MPTRSAVAQVEDRIIHLSALLRVPPERAFAYFTDNDLLKSWLSAAARVEPKTGGKYELFWEPNDLENNSTIGCRVTALASPQFLAFQWRSPKQFKADACGPELLLVTPGLREYCRPADACSRHVRL